jgi:hypothetical protein
MNEPLFCINCKHCREHSEGPFCEATQIDESTPEYLRWLVYGGPPPPTKLEECSFMRIHRCGPNARLFLPKDTK